MRKLIAGLALAGACGGSRAARPTQPGPGDEPDVPISVEWKVEQGDADRVAVSLVVDGTSHAIGQLDAATEHEPGTPNTCALRAASPRRTEIVCGDINGYLAALIDDTLVISFVGDQTREIKRIPVRGTQLAVKMLSLPLDARPAPH